MAISSYTGLPGHGKSYGVVENVIIPGLKDKKQIYTNIPVYNDVLLEQFGLEVTLFDIKDIQDDPNWFDTLPAGVLFIIDECWRLWPAGLTANNFPEPHKAFLAEHRHNVGENGLSTEIVLVTQDLQQISNFARSLVETTFRVTKLNAVGKPKNYRVEIYSGPVTGSAPPKSKRISESYGKFKKSTYDLYKSHTKSEHAGTDKKTDSRGTIFSSFSTWLIIFAMITFPIIAIYLVSQSFTFFDKTKEMSGPTESMTETQTSTTTSKKIPTKKQKVTLFTGLSEIYISFNLGTYPNFLFQFTARFNDAETILTPEILHSFGYKVFPISQCLVRITGEDFDKYIRCKSSDDEKPGLLNPDALTA